MTQVARTVNSTLKMEEKSREAARELEKRGIYMPIRPLFPRPELPEDVTELDDSSLMTLFGQSTAWLEWVGGQLAAAEVDEKYAESTLDRLRAYNAIANKSEKTVTAAKAKLFEDPEYIEAHDKYLAAYNFRKLNAMVFTNEDRNNFYYSRQLTRRVGRNDRDNRQAKWNT